MDNVWFRKTKNGLCWKPITWQGRLLGGVWIAANIWYLFRVDSRSHSVTDTLAGWSVFFIVSTLLFLFVIKKHSDRAWM